MSNPYLAQYNKTLAAHQFRHERLDPRKAEENDPETSVTQETSKDTQIPPPQPEPKRRKIQIQSDNHGHNGGNGAEEIKIKVTTKGKDGVQQMLWCWSQPFWEVPV